MKRSFLLPLFALISLITPFSLPLVASAESVPLQAYAYGALPTTGRILWVAPNGSDLTGTGSEAKPYATPGVASTKAVEGDTIVLKTGTYHAAGALRHSGTAAKPITLRPEAGGHPVFDLTGAVGLEIAGSHWNIYGLEITERNAATKGACLAITRPVQGILVRNVDLHDCSTGVRLSQTGSSVTDALFEDVRVHDVDLFGFRCSPGPCNDVTLNRAQIENVRGSGSESSAAIGFDGQGDRLTVQDSTIRSIGGGEGTGVIVAGADPIVSNTLIAETAAYPIDWKQSGTLLNTEIRGSGYGIRLRGGGTYRLRGNLIMDLQRKGRDWPVGVFYSPASADQTGSIFLESNRVASENGNLGLPASSTYASPLSVTLHGNTFFFAKAEDGLELPGDRFLPAAQAASATGTGVTNQGGNISVVGRPLTDDLMSPIYTGGGKYDAREAATIIFSGARLKASGAAVYLYGNDGKRHAFPNEAVYRSWFRDFSGIATISDEALSRIPLGKNVTYRPGVRLVKVATDPRVYAVGQDATLRWVQTEEAAKALFGQDWNKQIDDVPDTFFVNYTVDAPIGAAGDYSPTQERAEASNPAELF